MTLLGALMWLVCLVILKMFLHLQIQWGEALAYVRPSLAWHSAVLVLTFPLTSLIHEGGHYVAGIAFKQYCRRFVMWPVELVPGAGGWTTRPAALRHIAGLVDLVPSTFAGFRLQRVACAAGGPAASLLAGLIFTFLSWHSQTATFFWVWSLTAQWALVGLLNLLPIRLTTATSDGYKVWEAIRGGAGFDETQRNILISASHATPLRLRDWPTDLIRRIAARPAHPAVQRYDSYLAYIHFLDCGDSRTAGEHLDRIASTWVASDPPEYALEAAYFNAFHRRDLVTARKWLAAEPRNVKSWVRLRAEAAIEHVADNREKSSAAIAQALAALGAALPCGAHQYELDRLRE